MDLLASVQFDPFICWRSYWKLLDLQGLWKANYCQSICYKWNVEQTGHVHVTCSQFFYHPSSANARLENRVKSFIKICWKSLNIFYCLVHHVKKWFHWTGLMLRNYFFQFNDFSQWDWIILSISFSAVSFSTW